MFKNLRSKNDAKIACFQVDLKSFNKTFGPSNFPSQLSLNLSQPDKLSKKCHLTIAKNSAKHAYFQADLIVFWSSPKYANQPNLQKKCHLKIAQNNAKPVQTQSKIRENSQIANNASICAVQQHSRLEFQCKCQLLNDLTAKPGP